MQNTDVSTPKLRVGLEGPPKSGKTFSALRIAKGLCTDINKVAVIDTSALTTEPDLRIGRYHVQPLHPPFEPSRFTHALKALERRRMEVIIIDHVSEEWEGKGGVLDKAGYVTNKYLSLWHVRSESHKAFKDAVLGSPCHIITTISGELDPYLADKMESSAELIKFLRRHGSQIIDRQGWEQQLQLNLVLKKNHYAIASTNKTGLFTDVPAFIPWEETGKQLLEWCKPPVLPPSLSQRVDDCSTIRELLALFHSLAVKEPQDIQLFTTRRKELEGSRHRLKLYPQNIAKLPTLFPPDVGLTPPL